MLKKDVTELTIADLGELRKAIAEINAAGFNMPAIVVSSSEPQCPSGPFEHLIGKPVFIRTVTMYYTGRLLAVFPDELVISEAAWIPDTGRFYDALSKGEFSEVEPFVAERIVIGRGALLDACEWSAPLPRKQK